MSNPSEAKVAASELLTEWSVVVQVTVYALVLVAAVSVNGLTVLALVRSVSLHSPVHRFFMSVTAANLLLAVCLPFHMGVALSPHLLSYRAVCLARVSIVMFCHTVALLSLLCIGIDRYLVVWHASQYATVLISWRVSLVCAVVWTYALLLAALSTLRATQVPPGECDLVSIMERTIKIILSVQFAVVLTVGGFSYCCVFCKLRLKKSKVYHRRTAVRGEACPQVALTSACVYCWLAALVLLCPLHVVWLLDVMQVALPHASVLHLVAWLASFMQTVTTPLIYVCLVPEMYSLCRGMLLCAVRSRRPPSAHPDSTGHVTAAYPVITWDRSDPMNRSLNTYLSGSMLTLHTSMNGRLVKLPKIIVSDWDENDQRKPTPASYRHHNQSAGSLPRSLTAHHVHGAPSADDDYAIYDQARLERNAESHSKMHRVHSEFLRKSRELLRQEQDQFLRVVHDPLDEVMSDQSEDFMMCRTDQTPNTSTAHLAEADQNVDRDYCGDYAQPYRRYDRCEDAAYLAHPYCPRENRSREPTSSAINDRTLKMKNKLLKEEPSHVIYSNYYIQNPYQMSQSVSAGHASNHGNHTTYNQSQCSKTPCGGKISNSGKVKKLSRKHIEKSAVKSSGREVPLDPVCRDVSHLERYNDHVDLPELNQSGHVV